MTFTWYPRIIRYRNFNTPPDFTWNTYRAWYPHETWYKYSSRIRGSSATWSQSSTRNVGTWSRSSHAICERHSATNRHCVEQDAARR